MESTSAPGGGETAQPMEGGFTRKASGLVRDFSQLDAWIYNVLALNLVILISFAYVSVSVTFPHASMWLSVVITGIFCTFEAIVYAYFMSIMPRSGGDYVFQSRILGGGIATVFAFTAIVLAQTVLVALVAYLGATLIIGPFFILLGAQYGWSWLIDAGNWLNTKDGIFLLMAAYILWCGAINIFGLRFYAKVQRYFFWTGMLCVGIVLVMLLFTSHADFVNNLNSFIGDNYGTQNAYQTVIHDGGTTSTSFSLWPTILASVFFALFLAFPHWGVFQGGEIRRASSLKENIYSIAGAEVFTVVAIAIFAALITSIVGTEFLYASGNLFFEGSDTPLPVPPFFGFFVAIASGSPFFIWVSFLMFFCWYIMLAPNAPLAVSRMLLAMSFDRVLPAWFGEVNPRFHTPVHALVVFTGLCLAVGALYAYSTWFVSLTAALVVPSLTAFGVTMIAAMLFPKLRGPMYRSTVADRNRILGIPLMSICALLFAIFVAFVDYEALTNDVLGINTTKGLIFVGVLYAIAFAVYFGAKLYRQRVDKFDLAMVYKELPIE
jgi:basic amino acid/polyamine antiporter, APA family